jgi:predicted anti-sigma-YlaC factor YlaD
MTSNELMCQELVEIVTEYLEETLPVVDHVRYEAHLRKCEGCRNYLEQMRRTIAAVGTLSEDSLSTSERDRLIDLFRNWKRTAP